LSELRKFDFANSIIIYAKINDIEFDKLKYRSILNYVYSIISDEVVIIKNSLLNIKIGQKDDDGFNYLENLKISVQGVDSNKCIKEIINQCIENEISINLKIQLNDFRYITINF